MQDKNLKSRGRIVFIDLLRAYAILMMVQGHFIYEFLDLSFHSEDYTGFVIWNFFRGITAPIFFISTGLVYTYLLFKEDHKPVSENNRFRKGFYRAALLLFFGYFLRFNTNIVIDLSSFDSMRYYSSFGVDALHCIASGMVGINILYFIYKKTRVNFGVLSGILFVAFFLLLPNFFYKNFIDIFPLYLSNYLSGYYGSLFPIFPWHGFIAFGAMFGFVLSKVNYSRFVTGSSRDTSLVLLLSGAAFYFLSGDFLKLLSSWFGSSYIGSLERLNYMLFERFGMVIIFISVFMFVSGYIKNLPEFFSRVSKKSLFIYVLHLILIYGSILSGGLAKICSKCLSPWEVILGAVLFEALVISIAYYWDNVITYIKKRAFFPTLRKSSN